MRKKALIYLSHTALLTGIAASVGMPAFGDSLSFTASYAATPAGHVVGTSSDYLVYQCPNSSSCSSPIEPVPESLPVSVSGTTPTIKDGNGHLLNFGRLQDVLGTPSGTVTSTFTITVTPKDTTTNTTLGSLVFYGTVNFNTSTLSFSTSNTNPNVGDTYTVANYYGAGHDQTFIYEDVGSYAFGIENQVSSFKNTPVYAMMGPQSLITPEPAPLATTGLAICALLGFALRRKLQAVRS